MILNIDNIFRSGVVSVAYSLTLVVTEIAGEDIVRLGLRGDLVTVTDTIYHGVNIKTLTIVTTLNSVWGVVTGRCRLTTLYRRDLDMLEGLGWSTWDVNPIVRHEVEHVKVATVHILRET